MREQITQAMEESINDTFTITLSSPIESISALSEKGSGKSLVSSIGMMGTFNGSISILLNENSACKIVSKMLSSEIKEITSDVIDGIGEMTNMIAGSIKMKLAIQKVDVNISIPSVVQGGGLFLTRMDRTEQIIKNFKSDDIECSLIMVYKTRG